MCSVVVCLECVRFVSVGYMTLRGSLLLIFAMGEGMLKQEEEKKKGKLILWVKLGPVLFCEYPLSESWDSCYFTMRTCSRGHGDLENAD